MNIKHPMIHNIICTAFTAIVLCACSGQEAEQDHDAKVEPQELSQDEIPKEPPALDLTDLLSDKQESLALRSGNYSWYYEIGDDMMFGGEACGSSPLDEVFYKSQTQNVLHI